MKKLLHLTSILAVLALVTGCETTTSANSSANAASRKEMALTNAGFKVATASTDNQKKQLSSLPAGKVSAVKYKGKLFYVYPTTVQNQMLVGRQAQFNAYKKSKATTAASAPAQQPTSAQQGQEQMAGYAD